MLADRLSSGLLVNGVAEIGGETRYNERRLCMLVKARNNECAMELNTQVKGKWGQSL